MEDPVSFKTVAIFDNACVEEALEYNPESFEGGNIAKLVNWCEYY